MSSSAAFAFAVSRQPKMTLWALSRTKCRAASRPMPVLAPVIKIVLPEKLQFGHGTGRICVVKDLLRLRFLTKHLARFYGERAKISNSHGGWRSDSDLMAKSPGSSATEGRRFQINSTLSLGAGVGWILMNSVGDVALLCSIARSTLCAMRGSRNTSVHYPPKSGFRCSPIYG